MTNDTFLNGHIRIRQNRCGYRFSIDAVLLAHFVNDFKPGAYVLDLGTGCGIIPLILAFRYPEINFCGVEVQKELAEISRINVMENQKKHQIHILCQDMKSLRLDMFPTPVDCVVTNPPYRKSQSGRVNPNQQRAVARHEIQITLDELLSTASRLLKPSGAFAAVYMAERLTDMLTQMRGVGIEPKCLRLVHSREGEEARLVLIKGLKGGRPGIRIAPPLVIYRNDGSYTDELRQMFEP
ncbi:MAG: tRNA1(Val) (adenine(37)-N6)-methyltransferase [Desulfobacterales bacterium]|nr:tRNA1(Val) (adenine(37)-N6)-methyltransferase [Desulfobacterales bacterium]